MNNELDLPHFREICFYFVGRKIRIKHFKTRLFPQNNRIKKMTIPNPSGDMKEGASIFILKRLKSEENE